MRNKSLKIAVKIAAGLLIVLIGFYFFWLSPRYCVPILAYHDFGYRKGILVTPEVFEKQMRYLKDKNYKVISLDELIEGIKKRKKLSHNTIVITMDDGYKDNYIYAYPALKKYSFPATIFLITNNVGTNQSFLNWDEVREMSKNKISFGAHTKNHVYLPSIDNKDILWDEIAGSKEAIEKQIGISTSYFSYPNGGFTEQTKMLVKQAGYRGACATNRSSGKTNGIDVYELNRISVRNSDPYFSFSNLTAPFSFRAKLSGYYNVFRKNKKSY